MRLPVLSLISCLLLPASLAFAADSPAPLPLGSPLADLAAREYSPASIVEKLEAIGRLEVAEAVPEVAKLSVHASPEVRRAAVKALGQLGGKADVNKPLIAALADVDFQVQTEAVKALGMVKATAALPQLIALAGITTNEDFRGEILKAITAIAVK